MRRLGTRQAHKQSRRSVPKSFTLWQCPFPGHKEVKNITQAITRLGSDVVTNIIAMLEIYAMTDDAPELPLEKIQNQSLRVATLPLLWLKTT